MASKSPGARALQLAAPWGLVSEVVEHLWAREDQPSWPGVQPHAHPAASSGLVCEVEEHRWAREDQPSWPGVQPHSSTRIPLHITTALFTTSALDNAIALYTTNG